MTRSNGPSAASCARIVSAIAAAVSIGDHSDPSVSSRMALSTPIAIASRSWSIASSEPSVRTVLVPPFDSTIRTASSTAHSSCGLTVNPRNFVSIACSSAVRLILPAVAGTRLTQTRTRMSGLHTAVVGVEKRRRADDGDRHRIALPEILDLDLRAFDRVLRRQVGQEDVLADGRAGPGARHERTPALRVRDRAAIRGKDRFAPEHVALHATRRGVVVDGQGAQRGDRRLRAVLEIRVAPDEIRFLDLGPEHVGLDEVEFELELVAVRAIALLEPAGRPVDADPEGDDALRLAGLRERVPQPGALLHRDVQLPTELPDIRDARGKDGDAADLDRPEGPEREAAVRDIRGGRRREDISCPRSPDPCGAPGRGRVVELRGAVRRQVVAEPLAVAHPVRAAGHDPEVVASEPHDRQVGLDAARLVEERRVDDAAVGDVHLCDGHPLDVLERAWPGDVEDRECREVHHPDAVTHREVLGVDDRRPPTGFPLGGTGHDAVAVLLEQRRVGLVPERPLPTSRLEENGTELALTRVERGEADVAVARPLLRRMDDAVGLVEALRRARLDVVARLL